MDEIAAREPTSSWSSEIDSGLKCAVMLRLIINNDATWE
jgi:hypothetical protein